MALGVGACGTVTRPTRAEGDADLVVQDFCQSFGQKAGLAILSLFADSARFDIEGIGVGFVGRDDIGRLAEYGMAVHERLKVRDIEVSQDTVRCRLRESNDWLGLLGVRRATYNGWFWVSEGRILGARLELTPESRDELAGKLAEFLSWLLVENPKALNRLLPGGRPTYDSRIVPELIVRLRQWQSRPR